MYGWIMVHCGVEDRDNVSRKLVTAGRELLKKGRWEEARQLFQQSLEAEESAGALEGLGVACSWLNDAASTIGSREKAFRMYRDAGDNRSAARVATWLAIDYAEFRGEPAVAAGWLQHARRLVEEIDPCEEQALVLGTAAAVKLFAEQDVPGALQLASEVRRIAESIGSTDGLLMAGAVEGLGLVNQGKVREGMRLLDEATATAFGGACEDLYLIGSTCCCLITACERVRDFDRAGQWCAHVKEFCRRWRIGSLLAVCRTQYSSVLISRGEWVEAEEELTLATEELMERRPALVSAATVRLAELRRRQGRFDEARSLFHAAGTHPLALLGQGALALDNDTPVASAEFAERFLRRTPSASLLERSPGHEILVRAYARQEEMEKARSSLNTLLSIVETVSTDPLIAAARYAEGMVAAGERRYAHALPLFEDAVDLYDKSCMPFESAEAHIELAGVLHHLGRVSRANGEFVTARAKAEAIGARFLVHRVDDHRTTVDVQTPARNPAEETTISAREREVLSLIAEGKNNRIIADELFLSVRTVERHISNIYQKLGLKGKAARAAAAAFTLKNLSQPSSPKT
jgi:ATP/maltotriose-dependent transcriptional regulator MalT